MKKKLTNEVICFEQKSYFTSMQYTQSVLKHTLIFPQQEEKKHRHKMV